MTSVVCCYLVVTLTWFLFHVEIELWIVLHKYYSCACRLPEMCIGSFIVFIKESLSGFCINAFADKWLDLLLKIAFRTENHLGKFRNCCSKWDPVVFHRHWLWSSAYKASYSKMPFSLRSEEGPFLYPGELFIVFNKEGLNYLIFISPNVNVQLILMLFRHYFSGEFWHTHTFKKHWSWSISYVTKPFHLFFFSVATFNFVIIWSRNILY